MVAQRENLGQPLDEGCVVSVLNRTAKVRPDGTWRIDNVPVNMGQVRVRATCVRNGVALSGQSDYISLQANIDNPFSPFPIGNSTPIPTTLTLSSTPQGTLTGAGATAQITVTASFPDGSSRDLSGAVDGTSYTISNPNTASISPDGLVTALASGTVVISALNDGAIGMMQLRVALSGDADNDGIPDDLEIANGLNPNNPVDAEEDADRDGLTNRQELLETGSNMRLADTDGDGILDGEEATEGVDGFITSPLLADTDGDGLRDKLEVDTGSDPTNPASFNLAQAMERFEVTPTSFVLTVNSIIGIASRQLSVIGTLIDGTILDLTSTTRGTTYESSDLFVANFGTPDGRVFAGNDGTATVTVANSGFEVAVDVTVRTSNVSVLSFLAIPGFANNVDVNGDYAFIAAGSAGLQVADVSDRRNPQIVGSLDTPGNANDIRVVGSLAYIADGPAGLRILDVSNPAAPAFLGTLDTPGDAYDVAVSGNRVFIADGSSGLRIIDVTNPAVPQFLGAVDTLGTAKGVDVSGSIAVLADGNTGLQVIDVSDPTQPNIIGSAQINGDSRDVVISGNHAFVADYSRSFTSVDLTNPLLPVVRASTPQSTGGLLNDVAVAGRFAFGADVFFVNGVPIIDVSEPNNPIPRAIMDFRQYRDDDGTGIAVDSSFVYLTAGGGGQENGSSGNTRLYIGQYLAVEDTRGIPPQVAIQSPTPGAAFVEGTTISVSVDATDDVEVASVALLANGLLVGTDNAPPYQFNLPAPIGATEMTLVARAVDFGANEATSSAITIRVTPDPRTTVIGRVVDEDGTPLEGAAVSVFESAPVLTEADGTFSISGVPTIRGNIVANAQAEINGVPLGGSSVPTPVVRGGVTDVGDIVMTEAIFETRYGASLAQCDDCYVQVDLPFAFPYFGLQYTRAFFDGNGRVSFNFGSGDYTPSIGELSIQPLVSVLWNDWDASGIPGSGIFYNGGLPGRAVFTWLNIPRFPSSVSGPRVTIQIILFEDGRIQFGYNGIAVPIGVTGISAGPNSTLSVVDFTALGSFSVSGPSTVAEQFSGSSPVDLDRSFILWNPNATGGFDVRVIAATAPPLPDPQPPATPGDPSGVEGLEAKPSGLSFISRPGQLYRLEESLTPDAPVWNPVLDGILGTGGEIFIELPECAQPPCLYYRVVPVTAP